jgi:hypothetical protein
VLTTKDPDVGFMQARYWTSVIVLVSVRRLLQNVSPGGKLTSRHCPVKEGEQRVERQTTASEFEGPWVSLESRLVDFPSPM